MSFLWSVSGLVTLILVASPFITAFKTLSASHFPGFEKMSVPHGLQHGIADQSKEMTNSLTKLEEQIGRSAKEDTETKKKLLNVEGKVNELMEKLGESKHEEDSIQEKIVDIKKSMVVLNSSIAESNEELKSVQAKVEQRLSKIDTNIRSLKTENTNIGSLKKENTHIESVKKENTNIVSLKKEDSKPKTSSSITRVGTADIKLTDAAQDSTEHGGEASRAIDGNTSPFWGASGCTHTKHYGTTWWQAKLEHPARITSVSIVNRGGEAERLRGFKIEVFSNDPRSGSEDGLLCADHPAPVDSGAEETIDCAAGVYGRYLRITKEEYTDALTLCEVTVQGVPLT